MKMHNRRSSGSSIPSVFILLEALALFLAVKIAMAVSYTWLTYLAIGSALVYFSGSALRRYFTMLSRERD